MFQKLKLSFLTKLYLQQFFYSFIPLLAFDALFYADSGMSASAVGIITVVAIVVGIIFEVPSGLVADKYSRKYVIIASNSCTILSWIIWFFNKDFTAFVIGACLMGLAISLRSGTYDAFIYDELKAIKREKDFLKVRGRLSFLCFFAITIASVLASFLIKYGYNVVLFFGLCSSIFSTIILWSIKDVKRSKEIKQSNYFGILKDGVSVCFQNKELLKVLFIFAFIFSSMNGLYKYIQLLFKDVGFVQSDIAWIMAVLSLCSGVARLNVYKIKKLSLKQINYIYLVIAICFVIVSLIFSKNVILFLVLLFAVQRGMWLYLNGFIQKHIESKIRATVVSVMSFSMSCIGVAVVLGFGFIADLFSYQIAFCTLGIFLFIITLVGRLVVFR